MRKTDSMMMLFDAFHRDFHVLSDKSLGRRTTHISSRWIGGIVLRRIRYRIASARIGNPTTRRASKVDPYCLGCDLSAFKMISSFMQIILILWPAPPTHQTMHLIIQFSYLFLHIFFSLITIRSVHIHAFRSTYFPCDNQSIYVASTL